MPIEKPSTIETGQQNSATAIAKGQGVVQNSVTDAQQVVLSGANAAKPYGVALEPSPGQSTATAPKTFPVVTAGPCKVKAGAGVTQGLYGETDASGNFVNATAGAGRNVFGKFRESGVSGDLVSFDVEPATITV